MSRSLRIAAALLVVLVAVAAVVAVPLLAPEAEQEAGEDAQPTPDAGRVLEAPAGAGPNSTTFTFADGFESNVPVGWYHANPLRIDERHWRPEIRTVALHDAPAGDRALAVPAHGRSPDAPGDWPVVRGDWGNEDALTEDWRIHAPYRVSAWVRADLDGNGSAGLVGAWWTQGEFDEARVDAAERTLVLHLNGSEPRVLSRGVDLDAWYRVVYERDAGGHVRARFEDAEGRVVAQGEGNSTLPRVAGYGGRAAGDGGRGLFDAFTYEALGEYRPYEEGWVLYPAPFVANWSKYDWTGSGEMRWVDGRLVYAHRQHLEFDRGAQAGTDLELLTGEVPWTLESRGSLRHVSVGDRALEDISLVPKDGEIHIFWAEIGFRWPNWAVYHGILDVEDRTIRDIELTALHSDDRPLKQQHVVWNPRLEKWQAWLDDFKEQARFYAEGDSPTTIDIVSRYEVPDGTKVGSVTFNPDDGLLHSITAGGAEVVSEDGLEWREEGVELHAFPYPSPVTRLVGDLQYVSLLEPWENPYDYRIAKWNARSYTFDPQHIDLNQRNAYVALDMRGFYVGIPAHVPDEGARWYDAFPAGAAQVDELRVDPDGGVTAVNVTRWDADGARVVTLGGAAARVAFTGLDAGAAYVVDGREARADGEGTLSVESGAGLREVRVAPAGGA